MECWCEGSCPVCVIEEVSNHYCSTCGTNFCPVCHGIIESAHSRAYERIEKCKCIDVMYSIKPAPKHLSEIGTLIKNRGV